MAPALRLADLWRLGLTTDTWTELTPQCSGGCPSARSGASLSFDETGDRLVLYGGWESTSNTYRREAWLLDGLDAGAPTWHRIDPDGESPQARFFHIAGYDPAAQQLVVFGGGAFGNAYKDSFGLTLPTDGTVPASHTLSPTTPLTARDQVTVVRDDGVLTVFGGFGSGTFPDTIDAGTHLADTWQRLVGRRATWRLPTPVEETHVPIAREGTADALDDRLVVFGGLTAAGTTANDTWALELSGEPTWQQLTPDGPLPPARWSAAYEYDPAGQWVQLEADGSSVGPAPRRSASAVHDPAADHLVMTFGRDSQQFFDDTWAFDFAMSTWHQLPT